MEPGLHSTGEQGVPSMATTAIEIDAAPVAVECQARVQELADVITSHSRRFRRIALGHLGNAADAEDAVQDALLSALRHVDQFKGRAKMSTWLTAIVINSARMKLRRRSPQVQVALDEPCGDQNLPPADMVSDTRPDPEEVYRKRQIAETLAHATLRLSPTLRTTFRLRDVDGLSIRETAQLLGVPTGTVKARLARARTRLRQVIQKSFPESVKRSPYSRQRECT
jgi:RNA polymerase sigma-70 factor (ECF subfamily)